MNTSSVRIKLDQLIIDTNNFNADLIPQELLKNIKKWQWGKYGWISPVSLIVTAAWVKTYFPDQDCCKIWAKDEQGNNIKGGFSIRSEDESITIPILAKHKLCQGFCSDNSGMQGSRAIEKMRSLKRLEINFDASQRTIFDLKLFALILNQINKCSTKQAAEVLRLLIVTSKKINSKKIETNKNLNKISKVKNPFAILKNNPDPELVKCVAAGCYRTIFDIKKYNLMGVEDHKTSADARSNKAGDISIINNESAEIYAIEVKSHSIKIDWQNIQRAEKIIESNAKVKGLIFVHENPNFFLDNSMVEIFKSERLNVFPGNLISFISLKQLYNFSLMFASELDLTKVISGYISKAPSIKPQTKKIFLGN